MMGHVAHMGEMRNAYRVLVGKLEGMLPLRRSRHTWENTVRMDLWRIWCEIVDFIHLAQDRDQWWALVNTVINLRVP